MEFTTWDVENDNWQRGNCAVSYGGGFWWNHPGGQNINGYYNGSNYNHIWWCEHDDNVKKSQLMIRPAV